jgi:large-conductance mechanosensitive channel
MLKRTQFQRRYFCLSLSLSLSRSLSRSIVSFLIQIEIESIKCKENEEKLKLKAQINSEKKLTEEVISYNKFIKDFIIIIIIIDFVVALMKAVKKLYQIVQEKKPKAIKNNTQETKRLEKEYKRLQLELAKVKKKKKDIIEI